jgi:hypothetical protein
LQLGIKLTSSISYTLSCGGLCLWFTKAKSKDRAQKQAKRGLQNTNKARPTGHHKAKGVICP